MSTIWHSDSNNIVTTISPKQKVNLKNILKHSSFTPFLVIHYCAEPFQLYKNIFIKANREHLTPQLLWQYIWHSWLHGLILLIREFNSTLTIFLKFSSKSVRRSSCFVYIWLYYMHSNICFILLGTIIYYYIWYSPF